MKSILILQNEIMEYRKPVYNGLAEYYKIAVLHSGNPSLKSGDKYNEIITPAINIGRLYLQPHLSLRRIVRGFDVVISMFDLGWPGYLAPLYLKRRPKTILWGHRYNSNRLACAIRDFLMARADRLLMYGDEEVGRMIERGVDPAKICVAWNTLHVPNHKDYSAAPKSSLLFVGRLQPSKRVDIIIEEFARIHGDLPEGTTLDIVGSPASSSPAIDSQLKRLAIALNIRSKVTFHGRVDDPYQLAKIFARAHAYVSPSPVGLGVLHSFAYGVPVITLRNERHGPEFHNLIHNVNAMICDDLHEFSAAMNRVCTDTAHSSRLGQCAHQHYSTNRLLSSMLAGFRKAIDE